MQFKGGGPTRAALIGEQADFAFLCVQQLAGFEDQLYCGSLTQALRWGFPIDVGHGSPWKTGEVFSGSGCSTGIGPFGR